ncbi:MAG: ATP-dependent DNA helicase RecG [Lachnospiraceae bacterium]|nr:ATP-dependent DNA helicase RecG [Lachnospiraceae bacterium]
MNLESSISELKGIGEKSGALFHKLHIDTIEDLLRYFPRAYESYPPCGVLADMEDGMNRAVYAHITSVPTVIRARRLTILRFWAEDMNGDAFVVRIFNMPYMKKNLNVGDFHVFYGKLLTVADHRQIDMPKIFKKEAYEKLLKGYRPIYACTKGLSNDSIRKYVTMAMKETLSLVEDPLPEKFRAAHAFPSLSDTYRVLHDPVSMEEVYHAKKRVAYEEFLYFLLSLKQNEEKIALTTDTNVYLPSAYIERFLTALPFDMTEAQKKCFAEIEEELEGGKICNRLIQGDVGCGKTLIAVLALLLCVANGKQGALMAPTEVLAVQHFQTITEYTEQYDLPFRPVLLTGGIRAKDKREALSALKDGSANLAIGTHALLEDPVEFRDLSLVVTDEQHRFGVRQRSVLAKKGEDVHTLVMSATPIPRSLAMILYGGLSVSVIGELPADRIPIKNAVVDVSYRENAYRFMAKEIKAGHQVYVICPMVESGVMEELENVADYAKKLEEFYGAGGPRIAVLHGKMKGKEKNRIMNEFAEHLTDILVSTTVIEVGINVPNATVMMIENAERFGLAALHQLRGRVGRGKDQSYCVFVDSTGNEKTKKRLDILGHTNDGFEIANADLKMRGPGEMSGTLQSGDTGFVFADIYEDSDMLYLASADADEILKDDPTLEKEEHAMLSARYKQVLNEGFVRTI